MFTGLIELVGTVSSVVHDFHSCTVTISNCAQILDDCHIGDSIAVNGACLTVTDFDVEEDGGWFQVWLAHETLDRTDFELLRIEDEVNLERAMKANDRLGGHFVQGHVDATATIIEKVPDNGSLRLLFQLSVTQTPLFPYLIPKGYVTIDGASLTLTSVDDDQRTFGIMLIQHTQDFTTLGKKQVGDMVNVEVDMVGKYVEKSVLAALGGEGGHVSQSIRALVENMVEKAIDRKFIRSDSDDEALDEVDEVVDEVDEVGVEDEVVDEVDEVVEEDVEKESVEDEVVPASPTETLHT